MLNYLVEHLGYLGIVAFLALCGCGIPIPEEVALVLAGVLSAQGALKPTLAFSACLAGALLGDSVMYAIGRHFGHGWLTQHPWVQRFVDAEKEGKLEHAVRRHGFKVMLLTRFLVGVRGPVYYAAGAAKVPFLRFLLWDLCSATLVVGLVFGLAYKFGDGIAKIVHGTEQVLTLVVVLALAGTGLYFVYKKQTRRMAEALDDITEHDAEEAAREEAAGALAAGENGGDAPRETAVDHDTSDQAGAGSVNGSSNGHQATAAASGESSTRAKPAAKR